MKQIKDSIVPSLMTYSLRSAFNALGILMFLSTLPASADAQLNRGFEKVAEVKVPREEITRQPDLWMMEVHLKSMRMVFIDTVDPKTGDRQKEQVWYLSWRAIAREVDIHESESSLPVNYIDAPPGPMKFIPEFTLITYDDPNSEIPDQILSDEILPAAMSQLRRVERAPHRNSVQVVQPVPNPVPKDAEKQPWIYGAATWRGIDPDTDFFKVILRGFSNGYEVRKPEGENPQIWRKVIVQRYARPGDRYDPHQGEFEFVGNPEWVFQPDAASPANKAETTIK